MQFIRLKNITSLEEVQATYIHGFSHKTLGFLDFRFFGFGGCPLILDVVLDFYNRNRRSLWGFEPRKSF